MLVRVPVVAPVLVEGHLLNRNYAALQLFAASVLELNGGVSNLEVLLEDVVQPDQDAGAL